jgi:hypothetical protein
MPDTEPHKAETERKADTDQLSTADLAGAPAGEPRSFDGRPDGEGRPGPLLDPKEADQLRAQWDSLQTGFVDEPRKAVEDADRLVATAMKRLAEMFSNERSNLEGQWDRGDKVSTEDLRLALRRYRSFFDRLLSV